MLNQSLSASEIERIAYLSGNPILAAYAGDCDDQGIRIDSFDDELEEARKESYAKGYHEGIGADTDTMLAAQRQEIARLKTEQQSLRTYLTDLQPCLTGDQCKTVAGRKEIATHIHRKLLATPRY